MLTLARRYWRLAVRAGDMAQDDIPRTDKTSAMAEIDAVRDALRLYGHDIRAAVSDVIGGLRLIDPSRVPADVQTQLDRVRVAGETLADLIDGATSLSTGRPAQVRPSHGFEFRTFLAGIEMRWSGRAREQGLSFQLDVDRNVPESIRAERIKLDRILGNLIANALKFTDDGRVTLSVRLTGEDLIFQVRDQGRGFSKPALDRLFTPDGRPANEQRPGTGLGLHISKELADGLGGTLTVENRAGAGADVTLSLPRDAWEWREAGGERPDLSDLTILVAEDNETNQILVRQMLEGMGARMLLARDGQEALDLLGSRQVDIALVDIEMPRISGIDVMRRMRQRPGFSTPMVALTAYVMRENREAIYAAGADGVIAKPIRSISAFGQAIRRHVHRNGLTCEMTVCPQDTRSLVGALDRNRFEAILQAAGPEGRQEFLQHLLQDLRSVRGELKQATAGNDTAQTRAQSHILISLAGAVGADWLQQIAESLNAAAHKGRLREAGTLVSTCDQALGTLIAQVEQRAAG